MLALAVVFLLVALLAYFLGAGRVADVSVDIAKWCFILFVVLLVLSFLFSAIAPAPYWQWPVR